MDGTVLLLEGLGDFAELAVETGRSLQIQFLEFVIAEEIVE